MKKAFVILVCVLGCLAAFAQGRVNIGNRDSAYGVDAPIFDCATGGTKLEGTAYFAQLFGGPAGTDTLQPCGNPVNFRTGTAAGYVYSEAVEIPGVGYDANAVVQLRAWTANGGNTWAAAYAAAQTDYSIRVGQSDVLTIHTSANAIDPRLPSLVGLRSFSICSVPEPSSFVLSLFGAAVLLIRPRKSHLEEKSNRR
jgi:hypothetical protein